MSNLKQSSVALLEEAIDRKIRNAQRGRDTTLATVTRVDSDGTTWVRVYGGAEETPVRRMTSSAQVGDTINVVFSGLSCMGVGNVTNPSASVVQVENVEIAARGAALAAQTAWAHADDAAVAAQTAWSHADEAADAASSANRSANNALTQLSIVEDVAGTLDWISKHGQYVATTDTTVVADKVYFEKDGDDYTPVVSPDPSANPRTEGWYVLDVTDSQSDFIMAHLAVTSRGLWVLPSGIGSATDEQHAAGYKVLLSSDGMYVYDSMGAMVIKYGENIEPSTDRPFYIGDPDSTSYILFTPASGGNPAHISIGGGVTIGSDKTLSELLTADDVTVTQNPTQTGYDVDIAGNTFSLVNGAQGPQGETGPQGPQGETGPQGPQGTSVSVSKVEYATSTTESQPSSGWSTTAPSTVAEGSWLWVKTTYSDSTTAVTRAKQGKSGTNGTSYYTHVRYSESADGTGHVASPTSATKYIGVYTGTSSSAPSSKASYKWSKYVGEDGAAGHSPSITTSHSGTTTTIYADGTAIGTVEDGEDGATPTITASKSGDTTTVKVNGSTIATINDGTSVTVSKIEYGTSSSASTQPSSWSTTVPTSITKGKWLWVKTTYSDNSTATTKSYVGTDGEDGKSVAIRSATKADGVTTVVLEETDGTTTTTKTLTIADGQDGSSGQPGANGYVHTAWANSADGATDFSTTVSTGKKYLGVYTDNTEADSTSPGAYSWSLIKGETGATAQWYYGTALTHTSGTATLATSSTAGVVVGAMYLNKDTSLCYKCTAISGSTATWTYAGNLTDGVIDNINVGGRNLLRRTANPSIGDMSNGYWAKWSVNDTVEKTSDGIKITSSGSATSFRIPLAYEGAISIGETITVSFDYRGNITGTGAFYFMANPSPNVSATMNALVESTTEWVHFKQTFSFSGSPGGPAVQFMFPYKGGSGKWFEIKDGSLKLEIGNVATDWTPAPEDTDAAIADVSLDTVEYIVGTQTAATGSWTGVTRDSSLYAGKTIAYKLPYAGSENASLQLKDSAGNNVGGNIPVYLNTTRVTTHFGAGAVINMTYDGAYWRASSIPNTNNYDRRLHNQYIKAAANLSMYSICAGTASGYKTLAANVAFDLSYPILYLNANNVSGQSYAVASGGQTASMYEAMPSVNPANTLAVANIPGIAANKMLYVKGTVSGNTFTCASTGFLTCNVSNSDDGLAYIPIGKLGNDYTSSATSKLFFATSKEIYCYKDGAFGPVSIREAAEAAKVASNYIIETASNDVWIHSEGHGPNSSGVATADTYGWRIGSVFELVRAGASYMKMWVENSVAKLRLGLASAGHAIFSPSGMEVYGDSTTKVAALTLDGVVVGKSNGARFVADESSIALYSKDTEKVFDVEVGTSASSTTYIGHINVASGQSVSSVSVISEYAIPSFTYVKVNGTSASYSTQAMSSSETLPDGTTTVTTRRAVAYLSSAVSGPAAIEYAYTVNEPPVTAIVGRRGGNHVEVTPSGVEVFTNRDTSVAEFGEDVRIGMEGGNTLVLDSTGNKLYQVGVEVASFAANLIDIGKNAATTIIRLCAGKGTIEYNADDYDSSSHYLEIKGENLRLRGTSQAALYSHYTDGAHLGRKTSVITKPNQLQMFSQESTNLENGEGTWTSSEMLMDPVSVAFLTETFTLNGINVRNASGLFDRGTLPVARGGTGKTSGAFHSCTQLYNSTTGSNGTITLSASVANYDYLAVWIIDNNSATPQIRWVATRKANTTSTVLHFEVSSNTGTLFRRTRYAISGTTMTPSLGNFIQNTAPSTWTSGTAGTNYVKVTRVMGYII